MDALPSRVVSQKPTDPSQPRRRGLGRHPGKARAVGRKMAALSLVLISVTACQSQQEIEAQREAFKRAGPIEIEVDESKLTEAEKPSGPYQVVPGDVLEIYMPRVLATVQEELVISERRGGYHLTRVNSNGEITVPLLGYVDVDGLTLQAIEEKLVRMYHPDLMQQPPTVVTKVEEYFTQPVSIIGAIQDAGTYDLRRREMSLVTLISKAGGLRQKGAGVIRIERENGEKMEPILLPVHGADLNFTDVGLKAGDVVKVEPLERQVISVIGLVENPTTIPYTNPNQEITLFQAIANAGGLHVIADPKYATVYRQNQEGQIVSARFPIIGDEVKQAGSVTLQPGDVVAVEHTAMTQFRVILSRVLRIGINLGRSSFWD